jgi:ribonuclease HI
MKIVVQFDGACSMQRCIAAGAAVAFTEDGVLIAERAKFLRDVTTPIAEYSALILGLQLALELSATEVECWGDAELIVRQVDGRYRAKDERLKVLRGQVRALMKRFNIASVREMPKAGPKNKRRHGNVKADALASECMNSGKDIERDLATVTGVKL